MARFGVNLWIISEMTKLLATDIPSCDTLCILLFILYFRSLTVLFISLTVVLFSDESSGSDTDVLFKCSWTLPKKSELTWSCRRHWSSIRQPRLADCKVHQTWRWSIHRCFLGWYPRWMDRQRCSRSYYTARNLPPNTLLRSVCPEKIIAKKTH